MVFSRGFFYIAAAWFVLLYPNAYALLFNLSHMVLVFPFLLCLRTTANFLKSLLNAPFVTIIIMWPDVFGRKGECAR